MQARHFGAARCVLAKEATVHYIIGNSTFYGHLLPVERLYADMLAASGYSSPEIKVNRRPWNHPPNASWPPS